MNPKLDETELRRIWVLGKMALLWERKYQKKMNRAQMNDLIAGRWKPTEADISTADLVEELRNDPYRPSALGQAKVASE